MTKVELNWDDFQVIFAELLGAEPKKKIDCNYGGELRKREFDGYKEITWGANFQPLKIGIECKKYKTAIEIEKIDAFATKIRDCNINKGIMVSFAGFQKGAIAAAKKHGIELIEFRNCVESDLDGRLMKLKITLVGLSPQYEIHNMNIKVLSPQLDENDKARLLNSKLTLDKGHNSHLYNSAGHYIGDFLNIVQNIYEQEKRYIKHDDENTINVNWKDKDFCFRYNWEDKDLLIKINDFKLKITYNRMVDDLEIGSNDVSDWFIMDNLTIGKAVLIPAQQVEAIKRKYNV